MPVMQGSTTVAAGAVNDNILTGSQFEFLPYNAFLEFGLSADATAGGSARIDIYTGQDIVAEALTPNIQARVPVYPDDFPVNDVAGAGERVKIRARNTHASAVLTLNYLIKITPYGE